MKITSVAPIVLSIPFEAGGSGEGIMPTKWETLDFCLVRIDTDSGLTGWGEAFGYFCSRSVAALIERSLAPLLVGRDVPDPRKFSEEAQRKLVLQGRYGLTIFALSGIDLALWDLRAKAEGVALAELLGGRSRHSVPAYASLVRYGDRDLVRAKSEQAASEGYKEIKLHEITIPEIRICREAIGPDTRMTVDVNCNWSLEFTREVIPELKDLDTRWLEEPIFPPEDFRTLAELRKTGMAIATGENACTAFQFEEMCRLGATDFLQPSITKVGGVSEFLKITNRNREEWKLPMMPHSPYFGPGYFTTLQMAAIEPSFEQFEYLYIEPEAWLYREMPLPENGMISIPAGDGLGMEPDLDRIERFAV
ncbi:MAG: mandelate racemase/muconate lactonizing enzyme family protein [Verrucomicrobiales bacterium]|nr:mandelate racemase/muconate lactonizing enzyme family protein [Verrucomicrobiales bacterium]